MKKNEVRLGWGLDRRRWMGEVVVDRRGYMPDDCLVDYCRAGMVRSVSIAGSEVDPVELYSPYIESHEQLPSPPQTQSATSFILFLRAVPRPVR